ncbi:MAG: HAMP domain-containing protein [Anaerolineae bacterium]|nr:HAMP domain-containing protein [Anaerolineae bacterium]
MRGSLFWKLMTAFAVVILVGIGGALLVAGRVADAEFRRYAGSENRWEDTVADLAGYYAANGSWDGVEAVLFPGQGRGRVQGSGPPVRLVDADGLVVASRSESDVGQKAGAGELRAGLSILVDGREVGTLLPPAGGELTEEQEAFLHRLVIAFAISGSVALLVALVLGGLLVRSITRPLAQLTTASRAVASGDLDARVPVRSSDEVGQLAGAFNQMAAGLARAEEARRQQTADIAHELRTPLTVIQGQLEALADGIFPADAGNLEPVLEQTRLLNRLVEDLRTLSLADAGQLTLSLLAVDVGEWVSGVVTGFRAVAAERGVTLNLEVAGGLLEVRIDSGRMAQVVGNVLDNALRHTPEGGLITVEAARQGGDVVVTVTDTGVGVPQEHLGRLFGRFWRGEPSRSRRTGGSGLGLAIAQRIVEAHGGRIWAENVPAGGLRVGFSLPGRQDRIGA